MKKFNLDNFFFGYIIFIFILGLSLLSGVVNLFSFDIDSVILEGLLLHIMIFPIFYTLYTLCYTCGVKSKDCFKTKFSFLFNIIDTILCILVLMIYPIEVGIGLYIYEKYELYYYILCIIFSFMPAISFIAYKKEVNKKVVKRVITRILMVIFTIYACYLISSCSAGFENFG